MVVAHVSFSLHTTLAALHPVRRSPTPPHYYCYTFVFSPSIRTCTSFTQASRTLCWAVLALVERAELMAGRVRTGGTLV